MNINQQLTKLMTEHRQMLEEKEYLREKYENLLEVHKNVLKMCRCSRKGGLKNDDNSEERDIKLKNAELESKVNSLENQLNLLEIQLITYKEDFLMERKDREAAQDRVIRLEQEFSDLCSRGCSSNFPDGSHVPRGIVDSQGFELLPSSLDFNYPKLVLATPVTEHKLLHSGNSNIKMNTVLNSDKPKGLKNMMSCIVRKKPHPLTEGEQESSKNVASKQGGAYEYDGIKNKEMQLKGRMLKEIPKVDDTFLIISSKSPEKDHLLVKSSPLTLKRNSDIVTSQTPSIIKVLPHSSSTSSSPKSPNRQQNNLPITDLQPQKEKKRGLDSDEILRCPACFRAFKASSEHYKLLQHMDSCGQ